MTNSTPLSTLLLTVAPNPVRLPVVEVLGIDVGGGLLLGSINGPIGASEIVLEYVPDPNSTGWDLCLDVNGNIAVASPPYALAQDAASEQRVFLGECWYDTTRGIPYLSKVIGEAPSAALLKSYLQNAALLVPGVTGATAYITGFDPNTRVLTGQTQITDSNGNTQVVAN